MDDLTIDVVYEDQALLVLNKPSGLLSVPGKGDDKQDCLSARVQARYADARVVHRLDMATSGLMVMARGAAVQRKLSDAFASRRVHKRYVAVVAGELSAPDSSPDLAPHFTTDDPPNGWAVIDLAIGLDWPRRPLRVIDAVRGKPSVTRWRVLPDANQTSDAADITGIADVADATHETHKPSTFAETQPFDRSAAFTRLELSPVTGRSHQLRVHLAALGHPILGDMLYAPPSAQVRSVRLLLHATGLTMAHPVSAQTMRFESVAPF